MAAPITETTDYVLGKGKVIFQEDTVFTGKYRDLGNASAFTVAVETENLEHYSSREGTKTKDKDIVTQIKAKGTLTLDDVNVNNLKEWLFGTTIAETIQTLDAAVASNVSAALDKWVTIGKYNITGLVVKDSTEATTYTLGTDYEVDLAAGLIRFLSGVTIVEDAVLHLTYAAPALNSYLIDGLKASSAKGHIFFVANPPTGKIQDLKGFVSMKPTGDLALIGDDWQNIQFELEFIDNANYSGIVDVIERGVVAE